MDPACILIIEIYDQCSSETDMISKPKKKNKQNSFISIFHGILLQRIQENCTKFVSYRIFVLLLFWRKWIFSMIFYVSY